MTIDEAIAFAESTDLHSVSPTGRVAIRYLIALALALARSPFDVAPCRLCGLPAVCVPDGLPLCKACGENAANEQ
jgi:hypothetical protein